MFVYKFVVSKEFLLDCRRHARPGDLLRQLEPFEARFNLYMSPSNRTRDRRSPLIGKDTRNRRSQILRWFVHAVRASGFKPQYLDNIGPKHIHAAVDFWVKQGLAIRTLQTRIAVIRMLMCWLGRESCMPSNRELLSPQMRRRKGVATRDKSWSGNGLDVNKIVKKLNGKDVWIRHCLLLQHGFGMRMKEAALFKPHAADFQTSLAINRGTKGGRQRDVPIETTLQRELLDRCKKFAKPGQSMITAAGFVTWKKARKRYYKVLRHKLGVSLRKANVTGHGLRFEYLCNQYFLFTGERPPIQGGGPIDRQLDREARKYVAKLAGHNRASVSSAYLGGVLRQRRK